MGTYKPAWRNATEDDLANAQAELAAAIETRNQAQIAVAEAQAAAEVLGAENKAAAAQYGWGSPQQASIAAQYSAAAAASLAAARAYSQASSAVSQASSKVLLIKAEINAAASLAAKLELQRTIAESLARTQANIQQAASNPVYQIYPEIQEAQQEALVRMEDIIERSEISTQAGVAAAEERIVEIQQQQQTLAESVAIRLQTQEIAAVAAEQVAQVTYVDPAVQTNVSGINNPPPGDISERPTNPYPVQTVISSPQAEIAAIDEAAAKARAAEAAAKAAADKAAAAAKLDAAKLAAAQAAAAEAAKLQVKVTTSTAPAQVVSALKETVKVAEKVNAPVGLTENVKAFVTNPLVLAIAAIGILALLFKKNK